MKTFKCKCGQDIIVPSDKYDEAVKLHWACIRGSVYHSFCVPGGKTQSIPLSHFVMGPPPQGKEWDHRDYKPILLGSFNTEEDAARAYNRAAKKYFGAFALLNFPDKENPGVAHQYQTKQSALVQVLKEFSLEPADKVEKLLVEFYE